MKKISYLVVLLSSLLTNFALAENKEIIVSVCMQDKSALYVEVNGSSAMEIYTQFAKNLNVPVRDLGGFETANMTCHPEYSDDDELKSVVCSFLIKNGKHLAYPQTDMGRNSDKTPLVCN